MAPRAALIRTGSLALLVTGLAACAPNPSPPSPSILSQGNPRGLGNQQAIGGATSADGRWVAFSSYASNHVAGDAPGTPDTFLRDRSAPSTVRIAENTPTAPVISADGRFVGYLTADGDAAVYDHQQGTTVSWPDDADRLDSPPLVSPDGSAAVYGGVELPGFYSGACKVRDMSTTVVEECPTAGGGVPSLVGVSHDARFVVYLLLGEFRIWDRSTDVVVPLPPSFAPSAPALKSAVSADGRYVTATVDGPSGPVAARLDRDTGTVTTMPGSPDSDAVAGSVSPSGRYVSLFTTASNLDPADPNPEPDMYVWDTSDDSLRLLSPAPGGSSIPLFAIPCGSGVGQALDDGTACVLTPVPLHPTDTNRTTDLYSR